MLFGKIDPKRKGLQLVRALFPNPGGGELHMFCWDKGVEEGYALWSWTRYDDFIYLAETGLVEDDLPVRDGSFNLYLNGAKGPLWLAPGDYRCTLDSAGAPLAIPTEFTRPETTPLVASVKSADDPLDLKAPQFSPQ